ncbi:hypothetical protein SODG_001557 [Sodalis praecaptivus]
MEESAKTLTEQGGQANIVGEQGQGFALAQRQQRAPCQRAVAAHPRLQRRIAVQPVHYTGQQGRHHQIRVGVRPDDAIFQAIILGIATGDTHGHRPIVNAPIGAQRT